MAETDARDLAQIRRIGPGSIPWILWLILFALNTLPWLLFSYYDLMELQPNWVSRAGMLWGRDFSNQWFGGSLALQGVNVYDNGSSVTRLNSSRLRLFRTIPTLPTHFCWAPCSRSSIIR